jgi:ABC-type phosphate transport system substrate-binding protein
MVPENPDSVAPIAEEEIILTVPAKEELVTVLSTETLQAIFAGRARSWSEVQDGAFGSGPISLWNYPAGHPLRDVIEAALLEPSTELAPIALLAPGPRQMVEALTGGEGGVGFLPSAWLAPGLQKLELEPEVQKKLRLPVLISSRHEFAGALHSIVSCLQVGLGHEALMDIYPSGG